MPNKALHLLVICILTIGAGLAQVPEAHYVNGTNSTGVTPIGSYSGVRENIGLYNLNLNITIPLFTLTGRNGMDVTVMASYNSTQREWIQRDVTYPPWKIWYFEPLAGTSGESKFNIGISPILGLTHIAGQYLDPTGYRYQNRWVLHYPDGTRRELGTLAGGDNYQQAYLALQVFRSSDASYQEFRETVNGYSGVLYDKNGTQTVFSGLAPTSVRDTNGNLITWVNNGTVNGWQEHMLTDTLGRRVKRRSQGTTVAVDVWQAGAANPTTWTLTPTSLTLPNGQSYLFEWTSYVLNDPNGAPSSYAQTVLTKITYPTGGYTRYGWVQGGYKEAMRVSARYVNDGGGEAQFSYSATGTVIGPRTVTVRQPISTTNPNGDYQIHSFGYNYVPYETQIDYYSAAGTLFKRVENTWNIGPEIRVYPNSARGLNPRITSVKTSLNPTTVNATRKVDYFYDTQGYGIAGETHTNGNIVEVREYDFGATAGAVGPLLRKTTRTFLYNATMGHSISEGNPNPATPLHILDRPTQEIIYNGSSVQKARTNYYYDEYGSPRTLIATTGAVQRDAAFGTAYTTRGNLSRISRWWDTTGGYLDTLHRYDVAGNLREVTDPGGHTTTTAYNATYQFGYPNRITDAKGFYTDRVYAFNSGTPSTGFGWLTSETGPNLFTTSYTYDLFGRLKSVASPDGGLAETYYSDVDASASRGGASVFPGGALPPRAKTYTKIQASPLLERVATQIFDNLGRPSMSGVSNNTSRDWTRTEYDAAGRLRRVSNPRTLAGTVEVPTAGNFGLWTTNDYDPLDRIVRITHQDGQFTTYAYSGREVTFTDPANNQKKSVYNGLGKIASAVEPDSSGNLTVTTTYQYDPMGNLTGVTQGSQSRSLVFDSLSQLKQESQPESGTTNYVYTTDSLLERRTDSRGTIAYYELYDPLHRVGQIRYSDTTPTVNFGYDVYSITAPINYGRGRRTSISDGEGSSTFRYDSMGRLATLIRTTAGTSLTGNYTYNLTGGIKSAAYPGVSNGTGGAPLTIYFGYDNAGRQTSAWWDNVSSYQQMVSSYGFTYSTTGATETTGLGNGLTETITYNNRLQPTDRVVPGVLDLDYSFIRSDGKNNGNIHRIDDNIMPTWDQSFIYDSLDRITSSTGPGSITLNFTYDRWGNKSQTSTAGGPNKPLTFNTATNRISTSGYVYDSAGNLTSEASDLWTGRGAASYVYDAENRIKSATVSGVTATYWYDGEGNRVRKVSGGQTRLYFYDPLGLSWERTTLWETFNLHFNGRLIFSSTAAMNPGKVWIHADMLGSPRVKSNEFGAVIPNSRTLFFPFGEQYSATADSIKYKFTGKERDPETTLDYFGARFYSSAVGRFTGVDPSWASTQAGNPQSWNRYSYVRNNPLRLIDPDGRNGFDLISLLIRLKAEFDARMSATKDFVNSAGREITGQQEKPLGRQALGLPSDSEIAIGTLEAVGAGLEATTTVMGALDPTGAVDLTRSMVEFAESGTMRSAGDVGLSAVATVVFRGKIFTGIRKGDALVVEGGRQGAKNLFRELAQKEGRFFARDKTRGGRSLAGVMEDGTPIRIRFKLDGSTRIQAGELKLIFER